MVGDRRDLDPRRDNRSSDIVWTAPAGGDHKFAVTVGIDPATGQVREIFATGKKSGDVMRAWIEDCCVLVSVLLQHGYSFEDLVDKINRDDGLKFGGDHASPLTAVLGLALDLEAEYRAEFEAVK